MDELILSDRVNALRHIVTKLEELKILAANSGNSGLFYSLDNALLEAREQQSNSLIKPAEPSAG